MQLNKEQVITLTRSIGEFQSDFLEKSLRLLQVLEEVSKHSALQNRLVLKGGTAINFMQKSLPRLSVDIDFNCIAQGDRDEVEPVRREVLSAFEHVTVSMKYEIKQVVNEPASVIYNLYYKNIFDHRDHIQTDINFMNRVSLFGEKLVSVHPLKIMKPIKILTLTTEELYAGKIKALLERGAPRDLYDTYKFIKDKIKFDERKLHQGLLIFGLTITGDFRTFKADRIERVDERSVLTELYPTLRKKDRPKRSEMINTIKDFLKQLLQFTSEERRFMDLFYENKFNPEMLFMGATLERVKNHPGIQWQLLKMKRK